MATDDATIPVVIVGGGPVGLLASIHLSLHGIRHVVYERHPSTSIHPKATGLNQRSMEILRRVGCEAEILKQRANPQSIWRTAWYTSLGLEAKNIVTRDAFGGGQYVDEYASVSPSPFIMFPQIRLEPIIARRANELAPDSIRWNAEVVDLEERDSDVIVSIRHKGRPDIEKVQAKFVIAADGGRSITSKLGIGWNGETDLMKMVTAHIRSPISRFHPDPFVFLTWFVNPHMGGSIGSGYMYHIGPYDRPIDQKHEYEEWVFACAFRPDEPQIMGKDLMRKRILSTLQVPDLDIDILSLSHWSVNSDTSA
jgi:2-polyprenyl-6-methoxyphenol hydroxylase-like FAD-dependent oxidoreductase